MVKLLEQIKAGWAFPRRAKKAHYFENRKSACGKYTISEYEETGLLPISAFRSQRELCNNCCKARLGCDKKPPESIKDDLANCCHIAAKLTLTQK